VTAIDPAHSFDDSAAYERFIGTWGRAAGTIFLDWLAAPAGADWLDIGCGTGLFTELIVGTRSPATVVAIDQAAAQITHARDKPAARRARFEAAMRRRCRCPTLRSTSWPPRWC